MTTYEDPADIQADYCDRNHTDRPEDGCDSCEIRKSVTHCGQCGASFEGGRWYTAPGSTAPNGCDHESLLDDWGNEVRCTVLSVGGGRCGDSVTTPGLDRCAFHQRWADQDECARVYQRLVAAR